MSSTDRNALSNRSFYPWIVIAFSSLFLFYKYVLQVSPSVMTHQLMRHFHLDGVGLGNLTAMYFYTYLVAQLFAGPLLDRFNAKNVTVFAIFISGIASILFAMSSSLLLAWLARALIGFGAAFATVSYMKMTAVYFKPEKFAFIGSLLATAAMLGSMGGEVPLALLIKHVDWEHSLIYCGYGGIVFAALFFFIVKNKSQAQTTVISAKLSWKDVVIILKKKGNWLMMFYSGLAFVPITLFGGLWGNPFLETAYGLSTTDAATLTTIMFVGLAVGSPVFGYLSDVWHNRVGLMSIGLWVSIISILIVLYVPHLTFFSLAFFLFMFGFSTGAFMLSFAVGRDMNNVALMATVAALLNTGEPILGAFSDPLVGKFLDTFWHGKVVNGVDVFSTADYHIALVILPVYLVLALVCVTLLRFTKEGKLLDANKKSANKSKFNGRLVSNTEETA